MSTFSRTPNSNGSATTPESDGIFLIMGMTGSGKSSFIGLITGDEEIEIGHGASSKTSEIGVHYWTAPDGRLFALVDTPGFDDSNGLSDADVLHKIASFLKETYGKINGLIYCQRIDVRAGGLTIRNLRIFEKICGLALKNAAIVTTRWDVKGHAKSAEVQQELVTGERYFKPLCEAGATTFGHDNTHESAHRVMDMLLKNSPIVLQMQEELARPGMTIEKTAAGSQLSADLDAVIKKHEVEMQKVREEMEGALRAKDEALQRDLIDELARLKEEKKRSTARKEQLKQPPSKWRMFESSKLGGAEGARPSGGLPCGLLGVTVVVLFIFLIFILIPHW